MAKKTRATVGYDPSTLTVERVYVQEGMEDDLSRALVVTMRSDLTTEESDNLFWDSSVDADGVRNRIAPFILAWNLCEKGQPVPPPATAGGKVLKKIAQRFVVAMLVDLRQHSTGLVIDSKRLTTRSSSASNDSDEIPGDTSTTTTLSGTTES